MDPEISRMKITLLDSMRMPKNSTREVSFNRRVSSSSSNRANLEELMISIESLFPSYQPFQATVRKR